MTSVRSLMALALLAGAGHAASIREGEGFKANPIRRVVTMMQNMAKKITEEGERDNELFEKYMCYCKNGRGELEASISAAETKIPQVESSLKESTATYEQLGSEIEQHKQDRKDAQTALQEATELRKKEAAAYAKLSSDFRTNIEAMTKAIAALKAGSKGMFLQSAEASTVKQLSIDMEMSSTDRDMLSAFFSADQGYAPQAGQITGILMQMKETMEKDLDDANKEEAAAISSYKALAAAKEEEIVLASEAIETKLVRFGELGVEIEHIREDLEDTRKSLAEDKAFLADLDKNCGTREQEYAVVKKTRAEEQLALADTIKLLNDDDALELFKKTLPTPALLQTLATSKETQRRALAVLRNPSKDYRIDLISLALKGKSGGFEKVIGMIEAMIKELGKEQGDDDSKKAYCENKMDKAEDTIKDLEWKVSNLEKAIKDAQNMIETLTEELAALTQGIKDLDKQVADATATRKAENEEFKATMQADRAAKELLGMAKNRLAKFYNKKLYKAPPKRELSEEERIVVNNGGTLAPTNPPGGISGTGIEAFVQLHSQTASDVAPPPPPEAVEAYKSKGGEQSAVVTMVDLLITDLDKEIAELTTLEDDSQKEYEVFIKDSAEKRRRDTKSIEDKEDTKADLEAQLQKDNLEKKDTMKEVIAQIETLKNLHSECDWLLANYDTRKEARAGEVVSLKNAKAVLSGADYSM